MKGHLNSLYSLTQPPPISKTNGRIMLVVHSSPPASYRLCIGDAMPISNGQFTAEAFTKRWMDGGWLVTCRRPILSNSYCLHSIYPFHPNRVIFFLFSMPRCKRITRRHLDARGCLLLLSVRETLVSAYVYYSIFTAYTALHAIRISYIFCIHFVTQVVDCSGSGRLFYFIFSVLFVS